MQPMIPLLLEPTRTSSRPIARSLDQFYTSIEVAERCVLSLLAVLGTPSDRTTWIEPSAGSGRFLKLLPHPRIGLDIAPANPEVILGDFLVWWPTGDARKIVVGNPPFGKNSSLAVKFFNHAASFADVVAFIVPRTFQKATVQARLDPFMDCVLEELLPLESFEFGGEPYAVPTVFQVWRRMSHPRPCVRRATSHADFEFLPAHLAHAADFAFQRVGARAGLISLEGRMKSPQSHYFVRMLNPSADVRAGLQSIDWNLVKWRTAGNPSIGKAELVEAYEDQCGQKSASR